MHGGAATLPEDFLSVGSLVILASDVSFVAAGALPRIPWEDDPPCASILPVQKSRMEDTRKYNSRDTWLSQEPFENRCLSTAPLQVPALGGDLTCVCL